MTLKEARKMLETVKEKLELVVTKNRDSFNEKNTNAKMTNGKSSESNGSSNNESKTEAEEGKRGREKKSLFYFQP